jgi:hypothetical protein
MSVSSGAITQRSVHPTAPVLLTKSGPLGARIQRPDFSFAFKQAGLLTHLKFENRLR